MNILERIKLKLGGIVNRASDYLSRGLDRDSQMQGIQITPGGWRGGVEAVKQGIQNNPASLWMGGNISNKAVENIGRNPIGYAVAGAGELPDLALGGMGLLKDKAYLQGMTPQQDASRRLGRFAYGTALTAPLTGATSLPSFLGQTAKNVGVGAGMGASFATGGTLVKGKLPTVNKILQGAVGGAENSWLFPATSRLTDYALRGAANKIPFFKSLTDQNIAGMTSATGQSIFNNGFRSSLRPISQLLAKNVTREALETPLESGYMGGLETINPNETRSYPRIVADRFAGDLVGNIMFGAGKTGFGIAKPTFQRAKADYESGIQKTMDETGMSRRDITQGGYIRPSGFRPVGDILNKPKPKTDVDIKAELKADWMDWTSKQWKEADPKKSAEIFEHQYKKLGAEKFDQLFQSYKQTLDQTTGSLKTMNKKMQTYSPRESVLPPSDADYQPEYLKKSVTVTQPFIPVPKSDNSSVSHIKGIGNLDFDTGKLELEPDVKSKPVEEILKPKPEPTFKEQFLRRERGKYPQGSEQHQKFTNVIEKEATKTQTTAPSPETTKMLSKDEFNSIKDRKSQIQYVRNLKTTFSNYFTKLGNQLNKEGITIKEYESGEKSTNIDLTRKAMDKFANAIKTIDPSFKPRKDYISHMLKNQDNKNILEEVDEGIWIGMEDQKMGNIDKTRRNKIETEDLEQDWVKLLNRYSDQVLKKIYLGDLKGSNKFQSTVLDYISRIREDIDLKTGKAKSREIPNFVKAGNKDFTIKQKSNYALSNLGALARENNNVFKKIGGELNNAWIQVRDFNLTRKSNKKDFSQLDKQEQYDILKDEAKQQKIALQNFVEQAGKTEFENGNTQDYVNYEIAKLISKRQTEKNLGAKIADSVAGMFFRAHLYLSPKTGAQQMLEPTRLPSYYKLDTIKKGTANLIKNPIKESKRLRGQYVLSDFDDPFDINLIKQELRASFTKNGMPKKRAITTSVDIVDKFGFSLLTAGEATKNVYWAAVAEQAGKEKGLTGDKLNTFVRTRLFEEANLASRFNRANVWDNSLMRLMFQYSQYPLKNARQLADAFQGKETQKAIGLMGSQLFNMAAIMATTGLAGKYAIQQLLPIGVGPAVTVASDIWETQGSDWSDESKERKLKRMATQSFVPGGTQYIRSKEGLQASRGYNETAAGNIRLFGEPEGKLKTVQMILAGKNSSKRVRDSYDKDKQVILSPSESKMFKMSQQGQGELYKTKQESKANKRAMASIKGEEKSGFVKRSIDSILNRDKETELSWNTSPQTKQEKADLKALVDTALEFDKPVPKSALKTVFFKNKTVTSPSIEERMGVYKTLRSVMDDENYTDEQKGAILKASGADKTTLDYYISASKDKDVKLQKLLPMLDKMSNEDTLSFLMQNRTNIGGKQFLTSAMITYLYERDYIGEEEKELLNALQYDEVNREFYFKKSYSKKGGYGGSSSTSGSKRKDKLTWNQAKALFKIDFPKFSKIKGLDNLMTKYKSGGQTSKEGDRLISEILQYKPKKQSRSDLWF